MPGCVFNATITSLLTPHSVGFLRLVLMAASFPSRVHVRAYVKARGVQVIVQGQEVFRKVEFCPHPCPCPPFWGSATGKQNPQIQGGTLVLEIHLQYGRVKPVSCWLPHQSSFVCFGLKLKLFSAEDKCLVELL